MWLPNSGFSENANKHFQNQVGAQNYQTSQQLIRPENDDDSEFEDESDEEPDSTQEVIKIVNVHKTYLLGIEGVPALRGVNVTI